MHSTTSLKVAQGAAASFLAGNPQRVYLLPPGEIVDDVDPFAAACFDQLRADFRLQATTSHTLVESPEAADIVLAPIQTPAYGYCFERLRRSSFYKAFAEKLVVYSPNDNQFPALRGLYPSAPPRWVREGWALPAHYVSSHIHSFSFQAEDIQNKDILFSFVGSSRTHPIREKIVKWKVPGAAIVDSSATGDKKYWWEKANHEQLRLTYRDITRRSRFVICPRGVSPSSIRLFEAMEAGAVPVIVSDELELPLGPQWSSFALRIPEKDVDTIPEHIQPAQAEKNQMGAQARETWKAYFSPGASIGSIIGWAQRLLVHSYHRPIGVRLEEYATVSLLKQKLHSLPSLLRPQKKPMK